MCVCSANSISETGQYTTGPSKFTFTFIHLAEVPYPEQTKASSHHVRTHNQKDETGISLYKCLSSLHGLKKQQKKTIVDKLNMYTIQKVTNSKCCKINKSKTKGKCYKVNSKKGRCCPRYCLKWTLRYTQMARAITDEPEH